MNGPCEPDPNGDVTLSCYEKDSATTKSFRVSSKILQLASPVFIRMLSPPFREGQELLQTNCVRIHLEDDDARLMSLILDILHYKADREFHILDSEDLAQLAIHCDKYDCTKALGPWISTWFNEVVETGQSVMDIGFHLLASYMFNDPKKFSEISKTALEDMTLDFRNKWLQEDILTLLPTSISNAIARCVKRTLDKLEIELQSTESVLREYRRCYETSQLVCVLCGRTLPGVAKKCHLCRNSHLFSRYCTSETRVAEFFEVLRKVELWPTTVPFETCSISDITFRFTRAKAELKHSCAAGNSCPLLMNFEALLGRVSRVQKRIVGLCLPCIRKDGWEADTKCCHK